MLQALHTPYRTFAGDNISTVSGFRPPRERVTRLSDSTQSSPSRGRANGVKAAPASAQRPLVGARDDRISEGMWRGPRPDAVAKGGNASYAREVATTPTTASLLRDLRRQQGRSLRSAAADIGVAPSQLSRLERGQRGLTPGVSERLSSYYGVSADVVVLAQGEVPVDIVRILQAHPEAIEELRQRYADGAAG